MCLAIPGKIVDWQNHQSPFSTALVEFAGVRRQINMVCVPNARLGDYVLVHAGIAISQIQPDEAAKVFAALEQLDEDQRQSEFAEWKGLLDENDDAAPPRTERHR